MEWAPKYFEQQVTMYLEGAMQDGYLPLTTKPKGEVEEMDLLQQKEPQMRMILSLPPDPSIEAIRSRTQLDYQRLMQLRLKLRGQNG